MMNKARWMITALLILGLMAGSVMAQAPTLSMVSRSRAHRFFWARVPRVMMAAAVSLALGGYGRWIPGSGLPAMFMSLPLRGSLHRPAHPLSSSLGSWSCPSWLGSLFAARLLGALLLAVQRSALLRLLGLLWQAPQSDVAGRGEQDA